MIIDPAVGHVFAGFLFQQWSLGRTMAEFHIHAIHQKGNPLTARFQRRQSELGETFKHALENNTRELDHLQKRMGKGPSFDEALKKIKTQAFRWRTVNT